MTLNAKIGVLWIFWRFWAGDIFQEPTALNSLQIDQDHLRIKFSALNEDFNGLSLDLLNYIFRFQMIIFYYAVSAILSVLNYNN